MLVIYDGWQVVNPFTYGGGKEERGLQPEELITTIENGDWTEHFTIVSNGEQIITIQL